MSSSSLHTPSGLYVPLTAMLWSFSRASGPGGQNVNKVSSAATLTIDTLTVQGPAELVERVRTALGPHIKVSSDRSRSQQQNRKACLNQALELLESASHPPKIRKATVVPAASKTKRIDDKKRTAQKKSDRKVPSRAAGRATLAKPAAKRPAAKKPAASRNGSKTR